MVLTTAPPPLPPLDPTWFAKIFGGQTGEQSDPNVEGIDRMILFGEVMLKLGVTNSVHQRNPHWNMVNLRVEISFKFLACVFNAYLFF